MLSSKAQVGKGKRHINNIYSRLHHFDEKLLYLPHQLNTFKCMQLCILEGHTLKFLVIYTIYKETKIFS
jgi:hypothetical protein